MAVDQYRMKILEDWNWNWKLNEEYELSKQLPMSFLSLRRVFSGEGSVSRVIETNQETAEKSHDSIWTIVYGIYRRQSWKEWEVTDYSLEYQDLVFLFRKLLSNLGPIFLDSTLYDMGGCPRVWAEEYYKERGCLRRTLLLKIVCAVMIEMPHRPFV